MNAEQIMQTQIGERDAIVDLAPKGPTRPADAVAAIDRFQAFMREHPVSPGAIDIKALIQEGRS
jgi:hypothetical protein